MVEGKIPRLENQPTFVKGLVEIVSWPGKNDSQLVLVQRIHEILECPAKGSRGVKMVNGEIS